MTTTAGSVARMMWGQSAPSEPVVQPHGQPQQQSQQQAVAPTAAPLVSPEQAQNGYLYGVQDGMVKKDNGDGTFGILYNDQVLGTGYAGVTDASRTLTYNNASKNTASSTVGSGTYWYNPLLKSAQDSWTRVSGTNEDGTAKWTGGLISDFSPEELRDYQESGGFTGSVVAPTKYKSQEELDAALKSHINSRDFGGLMGQWEALGQALEGGTPDAEPYLGAIPDNQKDEVISGKNTLFGSEPVFEKDASGNYRLVGYRTDLLPGSSDDFTQGITKYNNEPYGVFLSSDNPARSFSSGAWRELGSGIKDNAVIGADGKAYIPIENVDNISFTNKAYSKVADKDPDDGLFSSFGKLFSDDDGTISAISSIAQVIVSNISWIGGLVVAADQANMGNTTGAVLSAFGSYMSYGSAADAANAANAADSANTAQAAGNTAEVAKSTSTLQSIGMSLGMSAETASSFATYMKDLFSGDISKMTGGAIDLSKQIGPSANKIVGTAVKSAAMAAMKSGLNGEDLAKVVQDAAIASLAGLVGSSVTEFTGSSMAGSVSGATTGGLLNQATKPDAPAQQTKPSTQPVSSTPAATSQPTSNAFAGSVARMMWS